MVLLPIKIMLTLFALSAPWMSKAMEQIQIA